ncbi:hypothetical protein CHELA1G11_20561 [Hyphomicrobiales bacterium]|nr:hypothetical protein CHELA1G11_20561 [Hyphomicrobiales bacterium]CAH1690810.1 hypothetical protein CHELA1G2_20877 [Hyphomicrobiales bacterium]
MLVAAAISLHYGLYERNLPLLQLGIFPCQFAALNASLAPARIPIARESCASGHEVVD